MKLLLTILTVFLAVTATGSADELSTAKLKYEVALAKLEQAYLQKTNDLQKAYVLELRKEQGIAMKSGDLRRANLVEQEIQKFSTISNSLFSDTEWEMRYLDKKMQPTKVRFFSGGLCETERSGRIYKTKWWISDKGDLLFTSMSGKHHAFSAPLDKKELLGSYPKGRLALLNRKPLPE